MLKVLYDYQIFQMQKFGGISRYFYELMKNSNSVGYEHDLSLLLSSNEYLFESEKVSRTIHLPLDISPKFYRINNQINKSFSLMKMKFGSADVIHPTFYEDYFIDTIKKPFVITVYDLINEKFPEYFKRNDEFIAKKRKLMEKATRIIAISENTKEDLVNYFKIDELKIDVTYLAESLSPIKSLPINSLPERYILFIGKRDGYKNFDKMYESIKNYLKEDSDVFLVCGGGGAFTPQEKSKFQKDFVENKVKHISFSKNEELKYLYEKAVCFIFPSLYEGFGIPVLESFASGCLTCISNSSSLKEIGGNAALYFDPNSIDDMRQVIGQALKMDRISNINAGFEELKKYNWKKTTDQTFEVYKKC